MYRKVNEMDTKEVVKIPQELETNVANITSVVKIFDVKSKEDVEKASELLSKIKKAIKYAEDTRLSFTRPLNESLEAINSKFKEATRPLLESESIVKNKILAWRKEENEKIQKEEERRRKIQESHIQRGNEVKAPIKMERVDNTVGKAQARKVKKWELVDFALLPIDYKTVDERALNDAVRGGLTEIPGVRIYEEEILAIRG
jgi:hypothetical protein